MKILKNTSNYVLVGKSTKWITQQLWFYYFFLKLATLLPGSLDRLRNAAKLDARGSQYYALFINKRIVSFYCEFNSDWYQPIIIESKRLLSFLSTIIIFLPLWDKLSPLTMLPFKNYNIYFKLSNWSCYVVYHYDNWFIKNTAS